MKRATLLLGVCALAFGSAAFALRGPEDLLPPGFGDPPPRPAPTATARPTPAPGPAQPQPQRPNPVNPPPISGPAQGPVVQPIPEPPGGSVPLELPENFPSLAELEEMEADEVNQLLGLKPKFDIPPAARRALLRVGVIASAEGGFASGSLKSQPARLIRAALQASDGPLVSRWGHILMRRALASRLDAPDGMSAVEFAALRARALNGMGENVVARALVQDVDGSNYDRALADAAFDAYLATGDLLGMCPVARLQSALREDGEWELMQGICLAYLGETRGAERRLQRALGTGVAPEIDVRLAQRYAGAAGEGRRAVNIEWDGIDELTPWRFALSRALGEELPSELQSSALARFTAAELLIPATPLIQRVAAADRVGGRGILSSAAMVDLYSQLYASDQYGADEKVAARALRDAYVAADPDDRLAAMQRLWGDDGDYGRQVLTAYAAARMPVSGDYADQAPRLIASMLAAGLDRNAMRWANVVADGSQGWALLALVQPRGEAVSNGDLDSFVDDDSSADQRKSKYLLAGLAGLGRVESDELSSFSSRLELNLTRQSAWSERISKAGEMRNPALVAMLAGLGMQGNSWERMTPRHLYHIVRALNRAGLTAEARMIAAEAVARG